MRVPVAAAVLVFAASAALVGGLATSAKSNPTDGLAAIKANRLHGFYVVAPSPCGDSCSVRYGRDEAMAVRSGEKIRLKAQNPGLDAVVRFGRMTATSYTPLGRSINAKKVAPERWNFRIPRDLSRRANTLEVTIDRPNGVKRYHMPIRKLRSR
jgi:hypothetical protein